MAAVVRHLRNQRLRHRCPDANPHELGWTRVRIAHILPINITPPCMTVKHNPHD